MAQELQGKKVAFLAADAYEESELKKPWQALEEAGAELTLVSLEEGEITALNEQELKPGATHPVDEIVGQARAEDYDALVLPGGVGNPDKLRADPDAVEFVRAFFEAGKPVGAICHGPWTIVEADVVRGRTLTSYPSIKTDIRNAGGTWVDEEVHVDQGLVTSRKPDDIPAFVEKLIEEIAEGRHAEQAEKTEAATA
ncbi:MAG: protease [Gaiellaceae bacterium]|jgi:protease I|nr:protease [Gaiellaceae bacterium]MDX6517386.1 protease [Gaiellaceae bacterium]